MEALNIMVVDDSRVSARNLANTLGLLGHRVVKTARSGAEALEAYPNFLPDLVTMDIAMPDMDGIEVTRRICRTFPDALIVMVSSHGREEKLLEALAAGAKGYLRKPISRAYLEQTINRIVTAAIRATPNTQICALFMADFAPSSGIVDDGRTAHLTMFIGGQLNAIGDRCQIILQKHNGNGFLICGADTTEMAEAALGARDHCRMLDWRQMGYGAAIAIRAVLDLDKVTLIEKDAQIIDIGGAGLDRAARIEPIVAPGQVWCSGHFYRQLEREKAKGIKGTPLGQTMLAEGFGTEELFALDWTTADVMA